MSAIIKQHLWSGDVTYKRISVTPQIAAKWISESKITNRNINKARVDMYADEMMNGRWKQNGETIKFDDAGNLFDGRHRLSAIIKSGLTIDLDVATGLSPQSFPTIDQQRPRSAANVLHIAGHMSTNVLAAAARWFVYLSQGGLIGRPISNSKIEEVVEQHPGLSKWARIVASNKKAIIVCPSAFCAVFYMAAQKHGDELIECFVDELASGESLKKGDPAYELRERMLANKSSIAKLPTHIQVAFCIKAINAAVLGKPIGILRQKDSDGFPLLV